MNQLNITGYKKLPTGIIPEAKLESVREDIRQLERSIIMDGNAKEEVKPIRRLLNLLDKEVEYSLELERTLRDNLAPVLNQQPKVESTGPTDEDMGASSSIFNDLESLYLRYKNLNIGLIGLIEDLEI